MAHTKKLSGKMKKNEKLRYRKNNEKPLGKASVSSFGFPAAPGVTEAVGAEELGVGQSLPQRKAQVGGLIPFKGSF